MHGATGPRTPGGLGGFTLPARGSATSGPLLAWQAAYAALVSVALLAVLVPGWAANYLVRLARVRRERRKARRRVCPACGYSLCGIRVARCPECGSHVRTARRRRLSGEPHGIHR